MTDAPRYYGKYRGICVNPVDIALKGRIMASVTVGGTPLQIVAEACTPLAGPAVGFYAIPPAGAGVWIEFEEGNLDKPIWTGCWWMEGEVLAMLAPDVPPPDPATAPQNIVLRVATARLKLNTVTGSVTMETLVPPSTPALPTRVTVTPLFVEISYGINNIKVTPQGIIVNNGALVVI